MITILVAIVAAIYFYRDAKRRGTPAMKPALVVFFSYVGTMLLFYIVTLPFLRYGVAVALAVELGSIGLVTYVLLPSKKSEP